MISASLALSMAAFALAASISPGPVNIVALSSGASHGWRPAMRHVTGATVGFTLLLMLMGLGLREVLTLWPGLTSVVRVAGVAFLLWMAWKLAGASGEIGADAGAVRPSLRTGAVMQWLNPKAWLASLAGMGAYAADGSLEVVLVFSAIYFVICYVSIGAWAWAGAAVGRLLREPRHLRLFNRAMAGLLLLSALYLLAA